jgi:glycosyltransferase involved in cell wall biosynthesis
LAEVAAIIPAHNEASSIRQVVRDVKRYVDEVIVIDDCSTDETAEEARAEGAKVIRHVFNTGVGGALRTGYVYCLEMGFPIVVQLDADGQHDPKYIPLLIDTLRTNNLDIVTGSRFLVETKGSHSFIRRLGIRFFSQTVHLLTSKKVTDITSGYRVYNIKAIRELEDIDEKHWAVDQTLRAVKLGLKYQEVPVEMPIRQKGKSQFDFTTFAWYPFRMFRVILSIMLFRGKRAR